MILFKKGPSRLEDNTLVEIYRVDAGGEYPIHAGIFDEKRKKWSLAAFRADGIRLSQSDQPKLVSNIYTIER